MRREIGVLVPLGMDIPRVPMFVSIEKDVRSLIKGPQRNI